MKNGFTLVEVVIAVAVIGVLATISVVSYRTVQRSARDNQREVGASMIADALETYYERNGEYPACDKLATSASVVVRDTLTNLQRSALFTPSSTDDQLASIACGSSAHYNADVYAYEGDNSPECTNGIACLSWKLRYREESTGDTVEISSRRTAQVAVVPVDPDPEPEPEPEPEPDPDAIPGTPFTPNDIMNICASPSNRPDGYNYISVTSSSGNTYGTAGNDIIYVNTSSFSGVVSASGGDDIICANAKVSGDIKGDAGNDIIYITGGSGDFRGGSGNDTFIAVGSVDGNINGEADNDTFYIYNEEASEVNGGNGHDRLSRRSGGSVDEIISIEEYF